MEPDTPEGERWKADKAWTEPYHSGDLVWVDGEMKVCKGMSGDRVVLGFKKTPTGNSSPVTVSVKKITKHYRSNYEWKVQQ